MLFAIDSGADILFCLLQVAENKLTCLTAASESRELAQQVQGLFAQNSMRINLSTDVCGVEICGALKNVLAIAAGIVEGQGLGSNALAAVVRDFVILLLE
jgi:glycerol-3-phosphate dehydrogenase